MAEAGTYSQWALGTSNLPEVYVAPDSSNPTGSVPNLLRYAMNLDLTGQGALLPQPVVVFTDSGPELSITYRQRKLMPDVTLVPQYTNDLKNWTDVPAEDITQLPDDDINTARYIAEMPLPAGQALYLRVIAEPNNGPVTQWPVSAGGNGHYYQAIVGLDITAIRSAESYAISHGGYLVTITSADENNFVFNLANSPRFWTNADGNSVGPLLGIETGVTPTALNNLRWVNNEGPLTFTNWAFLPVFNSRSGYAGVQFYGSGVSNPQATWSFFVDGPIPSFVVEYDTNPAGN